MKKENNTYIHIMNMNLLYKVLSNCIYEIIKIDDIDYQ